MVLGIVAMDSETIRYRNESNRSAYRYSSARIDEASVTMSWVCVEEGEG